MVKNSKLSLQKFASIFLSVISTSNRSNILDSQTFITDSY
jgi:hypothetical protein